MITIPFEETPQTMDTTQAHKWATSETFCLITITNICCSRQQTPTNALDFTDSQRPLKPEQLNRSFGAVTMEAGELTSTPSDPMGLGMWSSAAPSTVARTSQNRPVTIHETGFSYCLSEEFNGNPAWDSCATIMPQINGLQPQVYAMDRGLFTQSTDNSQSPILLKTKLNRVDKICRSL